MVEDCGDKVDGDDVREVKSTEESGYDAFRMVCGSGGFGLLLSYCLQFSLQSDQLLIEAVVALFELSDADCPHAESPTGSLYCANQGSVCFPLLNVAGEVVLLRFA